LSKIKLDARKLMAAELIAAGTKLKDVAATLGVDIRTVSRWLDNPDVIAAYREELSRLAVQNYAYAMKKLAAQVDDANPWLAQQAARDVASRSSPAATGASAEVIVKIEGLPDIGMPDPAAD
jgi:transposase